MKTINASELKAKLLAVSTRAVAQLGPIVPRESGYPQDALKGTVEVLGDIVEPVLPPETWEANRPTRVRRP